MHHGAWHLYGHSHGALPPYGKSFDVGVDCWNYKPVSFEQVQEKMNQQELITGIGGD
jgi:calcineurin-like phosphoesterase family protein